jgi:hypothetical protein
LTYVVWLLNIFEEIRTPIKELTRVEIERYEEQVLSSERGNLRIRLRFFNNAQTKD